MSQTVFVQRKKVVLYYCVQVFLQLYIWQNRLRKIGFFSFLTLLLIFLFYKRKHPRTESNKSVVLSKKVSYSCLQFHYGCITHSLCSFFTLCITHILKFKTTHFHNPSHIQAWGAKPVIPAQECKSSSSCPKLLHRNYCLGLHHQHYCCSMKEKNKANTSGRYGRTAMNT